jgi:hypothetical protein
MPTSWRSRRPSAPPHTRSRPRERDELLQSRSRALARLQQACSPLDRAAVEQQIDELDARLEAVALDPQDHPTRRDA